MVPPKNMAPATLYMAFYYLSYFKYPDDGA
jgi:hypothetical protein